MSANSALFNLFKPEANKLLLCLAAHIDDAMLDEIAAADYGNNKEKHLLELRKIRDQGTFALRMDWYPKEVLELIRWSEPDDPEWKPGGYGQRGHWMRAFACAALLRAGGEPENGELRDGWNQTLIQLVVSLSAIGQDFYVPACGLLSWLLLRFDSDEKTEELAFLGVGLLWFALHPQPPVPDDTIVSLAEWSIAREQQAIRDCRPGGRRWLLGTTFFNLRHDSWIRLGNQLGELDLSGRSLAAQTWVGLIASELAAVKQSEQE